MYVMKQLKLKVSVTTFNLLYKIKLKNEYEENTLSKILISLTYMKHLKTISPITKQLIQILLCIMLY